MSTVIVETRNIL